ncbi:T-cell surface glycoprotein CD3 zeta chain isoform X2 [Rhinichthys klamathensis goyatoka]|uniref:T-cell surface glycoprotein CD3 zeta chain isoform X2 n=1 Tax=Rhinichthys klamathensis goyatoka TaxID=3034132 RepID=UPI0024B53D13|nr:T-cell surface glycoprotein CD3 zeta chain isoform X2 [Rhinichthys klamathensis goyatoka]
MMVSRPVSTVIVLLSMAPVSEAVSPHDPQNCYILDGLLLLYGIVITAFFVHARFVRKRSKADDAESPYQAINPSGKEVYSNPKHSAEGGRRRGGDDTYTPLSRKTDETYREIEPRGDRRRDQVYQGLSSMTKDTYDSLHMQQINPPPR